jgi:hypothetical protein
MFRRKPNGPLQAVRLTDRLAALGSILEAADFAPEGLSILASDDGFVAVGFVTKLDGPYPVLADRTLEITKAMIDEAYTRRQRE